MRSHIAKLAKINAYVYFFLKRYNNHVNTNVLHIFPPPITAILVFSCLSKKISDWIIVCFINLQFETSNSSYQHSLGAWTLLFWLWKCFSSGVSKSRSVYYFRQYKHLNFQWRLYPVSCKLAKLICIIQIFKLCQCFVFSDKW